MDSINDKVIPLQYSVLQEVVQDYPGILSATDPLISALHSDPKKWDIIVNEVRSYALKNFYIHDHHEKGAEVVRVVFDILLDAVTDADTPSIQQTSIDNLMFYLEKILLDSDQDINKYSLTFKYCFDKLYHLPEKQFFFLITNPHQLKKIAQIILNKKPEQNDLDSLNRLMFKSLSTTYTYWLNVEDPIQWFKKTAPKTLPRENYQKTEESLYPISHANLKGLMAYLDDLNNITDQGLLLEGLLKLPGYMQVVKLYEDIAGILPHSGDTQKDINLKISYLMKIIQTQGLSSIHESTLRDINRTLATTIRIENPDQIRLTLSDIFGILKSLLATYPEVTLYCIQSIGNEVYDKGNSALVEWYIQNMVSLGFQYPQIAGATDEWQTKSNKAHLKNIRVWLELIENNPKWSKTLISALIVHLSLGGVHISDTDLFQKDVTKMLNSDIKPVYNLIKQLAKLFPVYFSEIGAEGILREVSTEIDELTQRSDRLVHFLRKQSHVESSARVVDFIEEVILFWKTKNKTSLKAYVPEEIYVNITNSGLYVDELSTIFNALFQDKEIQKVADLLSMTEDSLHASINNVPNVSQKERRRAYLAVRYYHMLFQKYRLNVHNIKDHLNNAQRLGLPNTESLISVLEKGTVSQRLDSILDYLKLLKDIVLSPERYEAVENIFRKRHIAVGIPSMYGNYHERKFDAFALIYRLENFGNTLFEELLNSFHLTFITRATLFKINKIANLFYKALQLDGISSNRLENTLELLSVALEVRRFSFSQYIDIFKGFSEAVQDIVMTYYTNMHKTNLKNIIDTIGTENMLPKYLRTYNGHSTDELINQVSEQFLREIVSQSFGLQQLDNFMSNVLKTIFEQEKGLDSKNLSLLMSYDPKKALSDIHNPDKATFDRIHLGNKGYNLIRMSSLGLSIPPGFVVTTEVFRCLNAINRFRYAREHLNEKIKEQIKRLEMLTDKHFGDPENPLLVSVRSGGALSMPGMMTSFLNVGINESVIAGLIKQTGKPWFAWDCYRRFLQYWGMSFGMERDHFDTIIDSFKKKYKKTRKRNFTPEQMKEVAFAYRDSIQREGIELIDDSETQLHTVISQVFSSWFSQKAQVYREIMGLSENWGTAVIIQAMVYGNLDSHAGSGVVFTRNPQESGDRVMLWGDFALTNQGDDIVSGLVKTLPISNEQKHIDGRTSDISLEDSFPEIYNELLNNAKALIYEERWGSQEIEFTFEGEEKKNLSILQARDMTVTVKESIMVFIPSKDLSSSYLSSGIGVGGGALSGRVVFDLDEIKEFREKDPSAHLILVRSDTVPEDIRHISAADGLLTARGGSTSHASIIANRLGKTCIVGCNNLVVWEHKKRCRLKKHIIKSGDFLSIDGRNGSVFLGVHPLKEIKLLS
jgi:pyruvate,orthophosphate dikinase